MHLMLQNESCCVSRKSAKTIGESAIQLQNKGVNIIDLDYRMPSAMTDRKVYVSITGLRLKKPWHVFKFYRYAVPSLRQAKKTPGNIKSEVRSINGVKHTFTVWENKDAMREFLYTEPHRSAIKAFSSFDSGKTFGFETATVPNWEEVHALWRDFGQDYS